MILDDNVYEVTITVSTRRTKAVDTGKQVTESKTYIFTDFYTEQTLDNVLYSITPTV
jgi:hypothetical protein